MKKSLLVLSSLAMVASLFGCNKKTSTSTPSAVDSTSASVVSTSAAETVGVEFKSKVTEVEAKQSITLRAVAYNLDGSEITDDSVDFTSSDENEDYVTLPDNTTGVTSLKITGVKKGTVTITATAHSKKTAFASVEITVTPVKNGLASVMTKIVGLNNYTFTSAVSNEDGTTTPIYNERRTATQLIQTKVATDGTESAAYSGTATDDAGAKHAVEIYGIGVAKDDYATSIRKVDGAYTTTPVRIATGLGFLTKDNFAGTGTKASSPNDVPFACFNGMNPSWFPTKKEVTNDYVITGTSDDANLNSAFIEFMVWNIMDPAEVTAAEKANISNFADFAAHIDTTFTVVDNSTVKVTIIEDATYGNRTLVGTMSEVGTTADDANAATFLAATTPAMPTLNSAKTAIRSAVDSGIFAQSSSINTGAKDSSGYSILATVWTYYTATYMFTYYDDADYQAEYKTATGSNDTTHVSGGYVVESDGLHKFTYTAAVKDTSGTVTTAAKVDVTSTVAEGGSGITSIKEINDLGAALDDSAFLYTISDAASTVFKSDTTTYYYSYSGSAGACSGLSSYYYGETADAIASELSLTSPEYITGVHVEYDTTDTTKIASLKWLMAFGNSNGFYIENFTTKELGTAVAPDGIDALITTAVAGK
jgi:hypothetical protein